MFTVRMPLTICAVMLILIPTQSLSQQTKRQADRDFIQTKMKRFMDYREDFLNFAKAHQKDTTIEWDITMNLETVASQVFEYLGSARTLLDIWDNLSCEPDRAKVRWIILDQIRYYAKTINVCINEVNNGLSRTKIPAVANSGTQMKEDLREIKILFESIQFP